MPRFLTSFLCSLCSLCLCGELLAQTTQPALPASGLSDWKQSRPFCDWNAGAPYAGPIERVLVHDTRFPARPGRGDMAYTNLWLLLPAARSENAAGNWLVLERLRYQACAPAVVASNKAAPAGSGYYGRLLVDPRHPAAQMWIACEAQAIVRAGYRRVFFDNANMANADTYEAVDRTRPLTDQLYWSMMAAAVTAFRAECIRLGADVEMCANVAAPWRHPSCADFWWDLGVRALMLEQPDKGGPGANTYALWQSLGSAWLSRGGTLYIIVQSEPTAAGLAAALDSPRTFLTR